MKRTIRAKVDDQVIEDDNQETGKLQYFTGSVTSEGPYLGKRITVRLREEEDWYDLEIDGKKEAIDKVYFETKKGVFKKFSDGFTLVVEMRDYDTA